MYSAQALARHRQVFAPLMMPVSKSLWKNNSRSRAASPSLIDWAFLSSREPQRFGPRL